MARLIQRLAEVEEEAVDLDGAEAWYESRFGVKPDYSMVMERLFSMKAERMGGIRSFFEPTEQELEESPDSKRPTAAHRAIARLMKRGYIKVVVTTNFDRLLEQALVEEGIHPSVIHSDDDARGAEPLVHAPFTIIKVNGDYRDTRQLHTSSELKAGFKKEMRRKLEEVFENYGLIVCGWSAEYDGALRQAISASRNRRYPLYFCHIGPPATQAEELVEARKGQFIPIADADSFFDELNQSVQAVEEMRDDRPMDAALATSLLRRYAFGAEQLDRYRSLIERCVGQIESVLRDSTLYQLKYDGFDEERAILSKVDLAIEPLVAMAVWGGYWADSERVALWAEYLARLLEAQSPQLNSLPGIWPHYAASVVYYAFSVGLLHKKNLVQFKEFQYSTVRLTNQYNRRFFEYLPMDKSHLFHRFAQVLLRKANDSFPDATCVYNRLKEPCMRLIGNERIYRDRFVELEVLSSMIRFSSVKNLWKDGHFEHHGIYITSAEPAQAILTNFQQNTSEYYTDIIALLNVFNGRELNDLISEYQNSCLAHWIPKAIR